jgi:uncharacterized membrane-anchored protein YhcB (DUF1043 family)
VSETETNLEIQKTKTCGLAIASVVLGIAGFFMWGMLGVGWIVGLILGIVALNKIKRSNGLLKGQGFAVTGIATSAAGLVLGCIFLVMVLPEFGHMARQMQCAENLSHLKYAIREYANDCEEQYPTADKWCDLLVKYSYAGDYSNMFMCKGALESGDKGRCHYAMNPNVEPNSPNDVVLLFETKGGWNQFGGPEILTFENHKGKGCNILFNDGRMEFVKPEEIGKLKWEEDGISNVE